MTTPADLSGLTSPQMRLLESLAEKPRAIAAREEAAAEALRSRRLIEWAQQRADLRPTRAALQAIYLSERAAREAAEREVSQIRCACQAFRGRA